MDSNKTSKPNLGKISHVSLEWLPTCILSVSASNLDDEPYPSLSDYHDYEPNLEFDDSELQQSPDDIAQSSESNFLSEFQLSLNCWYRSLSHQMVSNIAICYHFSWI